MNKDNIFYKVVISLGCPINHFKEVITLEPIPLEIEFIVDEKDYKEYFEGKTIITLYKYVSRKKILFDYKLSKNSGNSFEGTLLHISKINSN